MKKLVYILELVMLFTCASCEKGLMTYQGDSGIYFDYRETLPNVDTIEVHWGLKNSDIKEQTLKLKVCLFGNTSTDDRKFMTEIVYDSSDENQAAEKFDYEPIAQEHIMPANSAEAYIEVNLLRRDDLAKTPRRITIKLIENDDLKFLHSRVQSLVNDDGDTEIREVDYQRVIYMDEIFPTPNWWTARQGEYIFGKWSATKCALICDVMGIDREDWMDATKMTQGYLRFIGKYMYRWLLENPQIDEDGQTMTMGTGSIN